MAAAADEDDTTGVPVKGGLYEVNLSSRRCSPVYWQGEDRRVLRGLWFAMKMGGEWLPLREDVGEQLEAAYRSKVWLKRAFQPDGQYAARVDIVGASPGLHAVFTGEDTTWDAWLCLAASSLARMLKLGQGARLRLRRGFVQPSASQAAQEIPQQKAEEEMDDYCSQVKVGHVVLMVHGIGQRMEKANLVDDVTLFRRTVAAMSEQHLTPYQRARQRILFIPCQWRRNLKLGGESSTEDITLEGLKALRKTISATVHDVLYYMSPAYCQFIIDSVTSALNRQYAKFMKRNPDFSGKVSLYGHSLGSVLVYDILCHQEIPQSLYPLERGLSAALSGRWSAAAKSLDPGGASMLTHVEKDREVNGGAGSTSAGHLGNARSNQSCTCHNSEGRHGHKEHLSVAALKAEIAALQARLWQVEVAEVRHEHKDHCSTARLADHETSTMEVNHLQEDASSPSRDNQQAHATPLTREIPDSIVENHLDGERGQESRMDECKGHLEAAGVAEPGSRLNDRVTTAQGEGTMQHETVDLARATPVNEFSSPREQQGIEDCDDHTPLAGGSHCPESSNHQGPTVVADASTALPRESEESTDPIPTRQQLSGADEPLKEAGLPEHPRAQLDGSAEQGRGAASPDTIEEGSGRHAKQDQDSGVAALHETSGGAGDKDGGMHVKWDPEQNKAEPPRHPEADDRPAETVGSGSRHSKGRKRARRQHAPRIAYNKLDFKVDTFFAVGSPLGLFLALRNIRLGTGEGPEWWQQEGIQEELPACRQLLNIFHPYDPVACRIEPLISRDYTEKQPVLVAYHRGGKRLHISAQEFSAGVAARSKAMQDSVWGSFASVQGFVLTPSASVGMQTTLAGAFAGKKESLKEEASIDPAKFIMDDYAARVMERLTGSPDGRIDHDATFEHQYMAALRSHTSYWGDADTVLFIVRHLFREIPAAPLTETLLEAPPLRAATASGDAGVVPEDLVGGQRAAAVVGSGEMSSSGSDEDLPLTFRTMEQAVALLSSGCSPQM
eukprot:SM000005S17208  [mRNA]  locus=s5:845442:851065:+ [translate_table: standard]